MKIKFCTKCKIEKELSEFYNNRTHKSGKTFWCKVCTNYQNNFIQKETKARWSAKAHQNRRLYRTNEYLLRMAKSRAKFFGLGFNIEAQDILIPKECPYMKVPFDFSYKGTAPSLDRIDSNQGYIKGNIQVISWDANRLKSDMSVERLIMFARGILEVHAKEGSGCDNQM